MGHEVHFLCDPGYELVGSESRVCQETFTWSGQQPTCRGENPTVSVSPNVSFLLHCDHHSPSYLFHWSVLLSCHHPLCNLPLLPFFFWLLSRELTECCGMQYSNFIVLWKGFLITLAKPDVMWTNLLHLFINHSLKHSARTVYVMSYLCLYQRYSVSYVPVCLPQWDIATLYNPLFCLSLQTSMSVGLFRAWMGGHVWTRWTSSHVSVPKAGLEPPVKAHCQHVGLTRTISRPHTQMGVYSSNSPVCTHR